MPPASKGLRGGRLADVTPPPEEPDVPYRIADEALFIYHPESGAIPARAFNAGDRVPADLVDTYGWHDLTHIPEWATAPPATAPEPSGPAKGGSED